jgi:hypothetical protein
VSLIPGLKLECVLATLLGEQLSLGSKRKTGAAWLRGAFLVVDLVVTVRPGSDLNVVAAQLTRAGLQVHDKLEAIGSITGSAEDADVTRLRNVPGVLDVTEGVPIQLGPPGTPR